MSCAILAIAVVGLAGCGKADDRHAADNAVIPPGEHTTNMTGAPLNDSAAHNRATAVLRKADGTSAGTATATSTPTGDALLIAINAEGLTSGERGVHVHMIGSCQGPDFTSAGEHWNPTGAQHGLKNPQGQHAGDMPNLVVGEDGLATLEYTLKGGTMVGLLDADGSALVIHEGPDDQTTDPAGASGSRIVCGVFEAA